VGTAPIGVFIIHFTVRLHLWYRLRLGDTVTVSPLTDIRYASTVTIAPFADTVEGISGDIFDVYVKPYFKDKFRPLKVGDMFISRGGMRTVEFKVLGMSFEEGEEADYCIVGPDTEIVFDVKDALSREEDDRLGEVGYDDIGGCNKQLAQIRELVELPLRHPQIFRSVGELYASCVAIGTALSRIPPTASAVFT
jgi:transitional endoplasmic reticulum ATPase